ncbi:hypothetical protein [Amphibacillus marinus]|nr:hypothetical protein [Amphibacillus marinus]
MHAKFQLEQQTKEEALVVNLYHFLTNCFIALISLAVFYFLPERYGFYLIPSLLLVFYLTRAGFEYFRSDEPKRAYVTLFSFAVYLSVIATVALEYMFFYATFAH